VHPLTSLRFATGLLAALGCLAVPASAHAQSSSDATVEVCVQAYTAGQEERLRGNRLKAIERLGVCSAPACPKVVVSDCKRWLREVQAELASVRFEARDEAGNEIPSLDVHLGEQKLTPGGDGWALVPPGQHEFRLVAPGFHPSTVHRSLGVGDREVVITVVLMPVSPPQASKPPARKPPGARETSNSGETSASTETSTADESSSKGLPAASVVTGAVGVVSLGVALGFGISARSAYQDLEKNCAPDCSAARAETVSSKAMVADIALVTGTLALGAAIWIYIQSDESHDVAIGVAPGPRGTQAHLRTTF
jgi:hypothetical protein